MPEICITLRHISVAHPWPLSRSNVVHAEWELDETDREGHHHHLTGVSAIEVEGGKTRHLEDYILEQQQRAAIPAADV